MSRDELTVAIAGALMAALLLGWVLRWMFARLNAGPRSVTRTADLAARLHAAEEGQARAEARLREVEADLGHRLRELQAELDGALAALAQARAQTDEVREAYRRAVGERRPAD